MQSESTRAMTSWIGSLASGGLLLDAHEQAGIAVAAYVVGRASMNRLRLWLTAQTADEIAGVQRAAIDVCVWIANADRELHEDEASVLEQIVRYSRLPTESQEQLCASFREPPSLKRIEKRVEHPALRELLIALGWELAAVDGRIDDREQMFMTGLARRFEISEERLAEIKEAIVNQVGTPNQAGTPSQAGTGGE